MEIKTKDLLPPSLARLQPSEAADHKLDHPSSGKQFSAGPYHLWSKIKITFKVRLGKPILNSLMNCFNKIPNNSTYRMLIFVSDAQHYLNHSRLPSRIIPLNL